MGKEAALLSAVHLKRKKKPMKKRSGKKKNRRLFNKVMDYLMSDPFMYAPLYSRQFSSIELFSSVSSGIGENQPMEGRNDKKLVRKIGDYLKSDTYLYAPLVIPQPWDVGSAAEVPVAKGSAPILEEREKKRSADVLKEVTGKADEPGRKTVNVVRKDQNVDGVPQMRSTMVTRTRVHRETMKHMIYQNG